jgi:hypothetical protein
LQCAELNSEKLRNAFGPETGETNSVKTENQPIRRSARDSGWSGELARGLQVQTAQRWI